MARVRRRGSRRRRRGGVLLPPPGRGHLAGVLDLYGERQPRALSPDELSLALAFSHLAVLMVLGDPGIDADGEWEPALDHRAEIHQAQGMVMVDLGVDLAEALVRMRAHAFQGGLPLIQVARAVIAGLVLPSARGGETP